MEKGQPSRKKRRVEPGSGAGGEHDALDQPMEVPQHVRKEDKPKKGKIPQKRKDQQRGQENI